VAEEKRLAKKTVEGIGKALVNGDTWKEIRQEFQVSDRQILKARERLSAQGWDIKKDLTKKLESVTNLAWEKILERLDEGQLDNKSLTILAGVSTDKYFTAMGQPTQRVQVVREDTGAIRDAIRDAIREAKPVNALSGTQGESKTDQVLVIS
jgi:hypothetical protein